MDKVAKAIIAGLVAGYAVFELAGTADSAGGTAVVGNEWVHVAVSTVVAGLATWAVPNGTGDKKL